MLIIEILIAAVLVYIAVILADLIILVFRYRRDTDNWEYPIDPARFAKYCEKIGKEKHEGE